MLYGACVDACVFEEYLREAKAIGIELDAEAYSIVKFVIQALCKKPNFEFVSCVIEGNDGNGMDSFDGTYTCIIGACHM